MHRTLRVSLLPIGARGFLKASAWEEVGAEGILPLVIKHWYSWTRGKNIQRLKKINQEMYSFLAGTSEKKKVKKKQSKPELAEAGFWVIQQNAHCNLSACSCEAN